MLVLAACTQSKRGAVSAARQMRAHRAGTSVAEIHRSWSSSLPAEGRRPLRNLYKGSYWSHVTSLSDSLNARLLVVSAGLGLSRAEEVHAPYSATFSPGNEDSVPGAETPRGRRLWWNELGGSHALRTALASEQTIVVLPNRYLEVVAADLAASKDRLLIFAASAPEALSSRVVTLESRMVRPLKTNVGALAPAAARHLLSSTPSPWAPSALRTAAKALVPSAAPPLYPVRERQTEEQVRDWLKTLAATSTLPSSATAALRLFRNDGRAFEQKRFHRLYHSVVSETAGAA